MDYPIVVAPRRLTSHGFCETRENKSDVTRARMCAAARMAETWSRILGGIKIGRARIRRTIKQTNVRARWKPRGEPGYKLWCRTKLAQIRAAIYNREGSGSPRSVERVDAGRRRAGFGGRYIGDGYLITFPFVSRLYAKKRDEIGGRGRDRITGSSARPPSIIARPASVRLILGECYRERPACSTLVRETNRPYRSSVSNDSYQQSFNALGNFYGKDDLAKTEIETTRSHTHSGYHDARVPHPNNSRRCRETSAMLLYRRLKKFPAR